MQMVVTTVAMVDIHPPGSFTSRLKAPTETHLRVPNAASRAAFQERCPKPCDFNHEHATSDHAMTDNTTLATHLIRNLHDVPLEHFARPPLYESMGANLARGTAARKLGASVDTLPPGKRSCPYHLHHAQEEMFIVLAGSGTLRVAGQELPLKAGDVIFIPPGPEYPHQIINTSDAPLSYVSVSTQETPEICEYPDSGKLLAKADHGDTPALREVHPRGKGLDYWAGEP
jgi:uncharacterized cupin superfamily protein